MALGTRERIAKKRKTCQDLVEYWSTDGKLIPDSISVDSPEYREITAASAVQLQQRIAKGQWTAEKVTRVLCHRALEVHLKTNCLTEIMFERAIRRAQELDTEWTKTGRPVGRLHGVPISVKDHTNVRGFDTTSGYSKFALSPCTENATIVDMLEEQGAIVFAKTNLPQTVMTYECVNPIFGRTLNPFNGNFGPGGSSGGEGALIALGGSCLGVGSDLGGSLRIPAHCCGIYSLKPSYGRISLAGHTFGNEGQTHIHPTLGPMARSIDDLELFMTAALDKNLAGKDSTVLYHQKFEIYKFPTSRRLKIGFYTDDGVLYAAPACSRAVNECVESLRQQGHELVPFKIPNAFEGGCLPFYQWAGADGLRSYTTSAGDDPIEKSVANLLRMYKIPVFLKSVASWILQYMGHPKTAALLSVLRQSSVYELYQVQRQQKQFFDNFQEAWKASGVDFVIGPGFAVPAPPHDCFSETCINAWSTAMYNLLNYSVGAVPVTKVKATDTIPDNDRKNFELMDTIRFSFYDPVKSEGLPVGVQVIGGYRKDDLTLAAMRVVDEALKARISK